jgi:hypothetical protein
MWFLLMLTKLLDLQLGQKGVTQLQMKFPDMLDVSPDPIAIDARSFHFSSSVASLIQANTEDILEKLPPVYEVCSAMRLVLVDWRLQHPESPLISWHIFSDLRQ